MHPFDFDGLEALTAQLQKGGEELQYLESVLQELAQAESEQDFNDIRTELTDGGYLRGRGKKQPGFQRASKPREFRSSAGLRILVGRNNRQNDRFAAADHRRGRVVQTDAANHADRRCQLDQLERV